jgi:hypothetical protein
VIRPDIHGRANSRRSDRDLDPPGAMSAWS